MGKVGGRFVMIIDVPRALSIESLATCDLNAAEAA